MASYRNPETGDEFTSGNLAFGLTMTFVLMVILSGALAALPAMLGWIPVAVIVWLSGLLLSGLGIGSAYVHIRSTMRVDEDD
jgi:hypothetical protein